MVEAVNPEFDSLLLQCKSDVTPEIIMNLQLFLHDLMGLGIMTVLETFQHKSYISEEMKFWQTTSSKELILSLEDYHLYFALCCIS